MKNLMFKVSVVCSFPIVTAGIRLSSTCILLMYPQLKLKWNLERTCYSLINMRRLRLWNSKVLLNLVSCISFHLAEIRFSSVPDYRQRRPGGRGRLQRPILSGPAPPSTRFLVRRFRLPRPLLLTLIVSMNTLSLRPRLLRLRWCSSISCWYSASSRKKLQFNKLKCNIKISVLNLLVW